MLRDQSVILELDLTFLGSISLSYLTLRNWSRPLGIVPDCPQTTGLKEDMDFIGKVMLCYDSVTLCPFGGEGSSWNI